MAQSSIITVSMPAPDIAVLTLDDPNKGANVLSRPVLEEFSARLDELESRPGLAGLVIRSGKPGSFIAGADLREFAASLDASQDQVMDMCRRGRTVFQRLSKFPFVTVAAIDGICVGGGAELAIWCDRRIMSDDAKTQFGFPEVKLGLMPGWGGTARMPRIVGLGNAVEMICGGDPIDAHTARLMDLASDVVPSERLQEAAIRLIRSEQQSRGYLADRQRWSQRVGIDETELTFLGATASGYIQQQTRGHYPAPLAALEVMLGAAGADVQSACEQEAAGMARLFGTPVNRALLNVFFLTDRNKKDPGVDDKSVKPRPIKSVGVVGAGIMGAGIAAANVRREIPVAITDAAAPALAGGVQKILEEVAYSKQHKGPDVERAVRLAPLVNGTMSNAELAASDLVIEAVVENVDVKKKVYARLEPLLDSSAILASNTSTIPISTLAAGLARADRFCGIHFFNPVRSMQLVEVIRGRDTSDQTVATAMAYAKRLGKSPVVVRDGPGFLVNRVLLPYMGEALQLLSEGLDIKSIDRAATAFGMPMGPILLFDVVGLDTALFAGRVMRDAFPERMIESPLLADLVKAGRLGQKNGSGFFTYKDKKGRGQPDPALDAIVRPHVKPREKLSEQQITARLFLPMLLEATRIISEKLVRDVRDIDLALIFGIGFPPFKGGLLFWADSVGAKQMVDMLKPLEPLGERFKPTGLLLEMASAGRKFYD